MSAKAIQNLGLYRPERSVRIDGTELPEPVMNDIVEVVFADSIDDIDTIVIKVSNSWDPKSSTFPYSGVDTFAPGREIELSLGYRGDGKLERMLLGQITSISPLYPSDGSAVMLVHARSFQAELLTEQVTEVYQRMTDSQIARKIAGRLGVQMRTDSGAEALETVHEFVTQLNTYDLVFLTQRARRLGYELMLDKRRDSFDLYFGPSAGLRVEPTTLKYGENLVQFNPTLDASDQVETVIVTAWDPLNKKRLTGSAARADFPTLNRLDGPVAKAISGRQEIVPDLAIFDEGTARMLARGVMERIMKNMVTATGVTAGTPTIRSGSTVALDGLDKRFNGSYLVTGSKHTFSARGYQTLFTCRREEI